MLSQLNKTVFSFLDLYYPIISDDYDENAADHSLHFYVRLSGNSLSAHPYSDYQSKISGIIVDKRISGWTYVAIAKYLDERGFKTPRSRKFTANHVERILRNYLKRKERRKLNKDWDLYDVRIGKIPKYINNDG